VSAFFGANSMKSLNRTKVQDLVRAGEGVLVDIREHHE